MIVMAELLTALVTRYGWRRTMQIQIGIFLLTIGMCALIFVTPKHAKSESAIYPRRSYRNLLRDRVLLCLMVSLSIAAYGYFIRMQEQLCDKFIHNN